MGIYTGSKKTTGDVFKVGQVEATWQRLEPLLSPEKLVALHLFGIPLVSAIRNPITGKQDVMTPDLLKMYIERAVNNAELETGLTFMPTRYEEKKPFDKFAYESFGYFMLKQRPVASLERITVTPSNEVDVYEVPLEWVEAGNLQYGQVNLIPLTLAITSGTVVPVSSTAGGALFLSIFGHKTWIPAFWKVSYTAGFPDGKVPAVVNELIGTMAAQEILSMLAVTYSKNQSASLSLDGVSQSVSTPGPNVFKVRMDELEEKKQRIIGKLKALYGLKLFSSHI
jgi:hypothetical protein